MSNVSSQFGYLPEFSGVTQAGLNPSQSFETGKVSATDVAATGNQTLSADIVVGGLLNHDPSGAPSTVTYPAAADLIKKLGPVGTSVDFVHRNLDASNAVTVTAGSGMTIEGTATIAAVSLRTWRIVVTSATTVTAYSLGEAAF